MEIADLLTELKDAREAVNDAEDNERKARVNVTAARQRYNELSKKFDAAVKGIREESPRDTDWWNEVHRGG